VSWKCTLTGKEALKLLLYLKWRQESNATVHDGLYGYAARLAPNLQRMMSLHRESGGSPASV